MLLTKDALADLLISGEIKCDSCSDLMRLVEEVRSGRKSKEDLMRVL